MKPTVLLWLLWGVGIGFVEAQQPRPARIRGPVTTTYERPQPPSPSITFLTVANGAAVRSVGLDQGALNLGLLSNATRQDVDGAQIQSQKDSFAVVTRFGLRIDLSNSSNRGTVTVSAYLLSSSPLQTVWVDGVQLSLTPGIIDARVAYGTITEHVLKIAVPASVPPGQLMDSIAVLVTPN